MHNEGSFLLAKFLTRAVYETFSRLVKSRKQTTACIAKCSSQHDSSNLNSVAHNENLHAKAIPGTTLSRNVRIEKGRNLVITRNIGPPETTLCITCASLKANRRRSLLSNPFETLRHTARNSLDFRTASLATAFPLPLEEAAFPSAPSLELDKTYNVKNRS